MINACSIVEETAWVPKRRKGDNTEAVIKVKYVSSIKLSEDRVHCPSLVSTVMNILTP
jgi:hypothetical protein